MNLVTVFGGTGFLGRHIVRRLSAGGVNVRLAVRHPMRAILDAARGGDLVEGITADIRHPRSVDAAVAGADGAVNAVSAYVERGGATFKAVHEEGAANVAKACARQSVQSLVHISGIGADPRSPSPYISARGRGERVVQDAFPAAVVLRPSVMFGADDAFLNLLARIGRSTPVIPLIAGGRTRLQPVLVDDVAEAVWLCLQMPDAVGRIYELAGPQVLTLRQIVELVLARMGRRRLLVPVPLPLAHMLATAMERVPGAPLSVGQVDLLKNDNLPAPGMPGLPELGISPRDLQSAIAELAVRP